MSKFQLPKTCQDQRLKIGVNNSKKFVPTTQKNTCQQVGSELARFYGESLEKTKFVAWQDGGRERSWGNTS